MGKMTETQNTVFKADYRKEICLIMESIEHVLSKIENCTTFYCNDGGRSVVQYNYVDLLSEKVRLQDRLQMFMNDYKRLYGKFKLDAVTSEEN